MFPSGRLSRPDVFPVVTMIKVKSMSNLGRLMVMMGAVFVAGGVIGCSDGNAPPPVLAGATMGPQRPNLPNGGAEAMKNSLKARPRTAPKAGQRGQVPH
jgi:hypothetical protein